MGSTASPRSSTDSENTTDYYDPLVMLCEPEATSTTTAVCFAVFFCLSLVGNTLVLFVLTRHQGSRRVTNLFVLNLAVSDLTFASSFPFWAHYYLADWIFGKFLCKLVSGTYFVGLYSSLMFLMALTVDRYMIVVHSKMPMLKRRFDCARAVCAVIWVVSVSASIREMVVSSVTEDEPGKYSCTAIRENSEDQVSYYLQITFFFVLPSLIIIFCYSRILKKVLSCNNRRKHKVVVVIFCIVITFFVCWTPYNLMLLIKSVNEPNECDLAFEVCRILAYSHCCLNPIFYSFTEEFQSHVSSLFCCSRQWTQTSANGFSAAHSNSNVIHKAAATEADICMT